MSHWESPAAVSEAAPLLILIPIYNDWNAVSLLLAKLDEVFRATAVRPAVLLINDGSTESPMPALTGQRYVALDRVQILALRRNLGHQRAIAVGLTYVQDRVRPDVVVVMDGDGEDAPQDVPRLIEHVRATNGEAVVFAERQRRSESLMFRFFYAIYRFVHLLLTGIPVRVGNFSAVPIAQVDRLVVVPELWNHYAAAVFKTRLRRATVPAERAPRLSGSSRMNFVALVAHGLSALSVHAELIGVRMLILALIAVGLLCSGLAGVLAVRLATSLAIPGWATTAAGLLLVLTFQTIGLAGFFVFLVLHARSQPLFIPLRDYSYFVDDLTTVFSSAGSSAPATTH